MHHPPEKPLRSIQRPAWLPDSLGSTQQLAEALNILSDHEAAWFILRLGLDGRQLLTADAACVQLDLSAASAQALENQALKRMRVVARYTYAIALMHGAPVPAYLLENRQRIIDSEPITQPWPASYDDWDHPLMQRMRSTFPDRIIRPDCLLQLYKERTNPACAMLATLIRSGLPEPQLRSIVNKSQWKLRASMERLRRFVAAGNSATAFLRCYSSWGCNPQVLLGMGSAHFTEVLHFLGQAEDHVLIKPQIYAPWHRSVFFALIYQAFGIARTQAFFRPLDPSSLRAMHAGGPIDIGNTYLAFNIAIQSWAASLSVTPQQLAAFLAEPFGQPTSPPSVLQPILTTAAKETPAPWVDIMDRYQPASPPPARDEAVDLAEIDLDSLCASALDELNLAVLAVAYLEAGKRGLPLPHPDRVRVVHRNLMLCGVRHGVSFRFYMVDGHLEIRAHFRPEAAARFQRLLATHPELTDPYGNAFQLKEGPRPIVFAIAPLSGDEDAIARRAIYLMSALWQFCSQPI